MALRRVYDRRESALLVAFTLGLVSILAALGFEHLGGYVPCKLCLWQRWPYYLGVPLTMAGVLTIQREGLVGIGRVLAGLCAVIFLISLGLGIYHAGVEWAFWPGPADCGGKIVTGPASVSDFRATLESAKSIRCDEAAWRLFGLSFAGWNALVSAMIAGFALRATSSRM